jgi:hypothetical protein
MKQSEIQFPPAQRVQALRDKDTERRPSGRSKSLNEVHPLLVTAVKQLREQCYNQNREIEELKKQLTQRNVLPSFIDIDEVPEQDLWSLQVRLDAAEEEDLITIMQLKESQRKNDILRLQQLLAKSGHVDTSAELLSKWQTKYDQVQQNETNTKYTKLQDELMSLDVEYKQFLSLATRSAGRIGAQLAIHLP